jgi:hypothetical protein
MKASESITTQSQEVAREIDRQTGALRHASRDAASLLETLKARADQVGTEDFLKHAAFVSERLQSLAVDMNRILEASISEEDWRRFNRGEKGIFVRKLLGFREKSKLAAINQKYKEDSEFREYVSRYLDQFGDLLKEARKSDHHDVLATTFLSSEMGKVYMLLARALDRDI